MSKKAKKVVKLDEISSITDLKNICMDNNHPSNRNYQQVAITAADSLDAGRPHSTFDEAIKTLQIFAMSDNTEAGIVDEVNYYINGGK